MTAASPAEARIGSLGGSSPARAPNALLRTPPLSLYIHIPWCVRKCPYCDFNSHAARRGLPERDYVAALLSDLDRELEAVGDRPVETVFIGGGTPSLFSPESIERLVEGIGQRVSLAPDAEITLEANPGTAEAARFRGFRVAGVNRLSIGVQSFDDAKLQSLGRIHDGAEAIRAVDWARQAGFERLNLDLMFGLPGQSAEQARKDVEQAIRFGPSHISFYHLTLEPNTAFAKRPPVLPDDEAVYLAQEDGQRLLAAAGFRQYEISAYARPGFECRHNLNYWRYGDYIGIGAGAHGKITDVRSDRVIRTAKIRKPESYLGLRPVAAGFRTEQEIPHKDRPLEFLMNHLRLRDGFEEPAFSHRTGLPLAALEPHLSESVRDRLLQREGGWIRCTPLGWNFLDEILGRFVR